MWRWVKANAEGVEAAAAIVTALVAVIALIGIKLQIDAQDRLNQAQSARETYREFLKISLDKPELTGLNWCRISDGRQATAYAHFAEYMLYTAEQVMEADPRWHDPVHELLTTHAAYVCSEVAPEQYAGSIQSLLRQIQDRQCSSANTC